MKRCGRIHDSIFFYAKTNDYVWNPVFTAHDPAYIEMMYRFRDENNRRYREDNLTAAQAGRRREL